MQQTGCYRLKIPLMKLSASNPLVSIIICTHNRAGMLKETMRSIFAQDYRPVDILVFDDGSTDNTPEVAAGYGKRIRYYWQENKGIGAARTSACQLAKGEYIAFQDDDDLMPPDRISCLYEALQQHPSAVLAAGDWAYIDGEGNLTGKKSTFNITAKDDKPVLIEDGYKAVLWPLITPLPHTTLFRKKDGERIGWMDEQFRRNEDTDFFARLGQLGPVVYVPKVVSYYRTGHAHLFSENTANSFVCEYSRLLLFEKHLKSICDGKEEMRRRLQKRMLQTLKGMAFLMGRCEKVPEMIDAAHVKRALSLLGIKELLAYKWYLGIRLPLRNVIKG